MVGEALRERGNYMVWKRVRSQEDVDCMNETFGEFHDCCLKEVSYLQDDIFFWSEKDYEFHDGNKDTYTWIAARFTQWRERDDLLGSQMVYMPD